ncbi:MAG TPA: MBL fold metallo-hydrolase, partial [Verrucomicrobiae bacterium]|nr:MBL fold metallo-hydrolase [Verrucomicrobiae bacterium]
TNPADERNRIRLAMRCWLLRGHGRTVLVDDGLGDKFTDKLKDIYRVEPEPSLEHSLAGLGLEPGDITDVVLTHLHFDHAGGSTKRGAKGLEPAFPNARWYVQRRNWENAHAPNPRERASYMPENYDALMEAGVLTLWDGPQHPWPGFETITVNGHTRGQQLVRVSGEGQAAYYVSDLIPTAAHVRIPFVMGYDMAAIETMEEKRALLTRAVAEGAWIVLEHDPETAMGRVHADGDDFAWAERIPAQPGVAAR